MVCIAAFIILCLVSVIVGFLSIFKRDIGKKYWKVFKKSWGCVGKRVTLQKCDTNFKDDVKNTILRKVVIKRPKLVKPLSAAIEVVSVLIVLVTVWSIVEGAKAGLALWTLGTCNVQRPAACSLSAGIGCSIDGDAGPQNAIEHVQYWFKDWGEIFGAIPDKFRSWDADQFDFAYITKEANTGGREKAVDIMDPGCEVCRQSFKLQLESGFFDSHDVRVVVFPIKDGEDKYKFANSRIIASYIYATSMEGQPKHAEQYNSANEPAFEMLSRVFTGNDESGQSYFEAFGGGEATLSKYSNEQVEVILLDWLQEFGFGTEQRASIKERAHSSEIEEKLAKNNDIVINDIHAKGIPTMLYGGRKHSGMFKE